jgi:hypothetical protein
MSYFYLPKNNNKFLFDLQNSNIKIRGNDNIYHLNSLNYYTSLLQKIQNKSESFDKLTKEIEPYKHVFNTVNTRNTNILYVSNYISLNESFFVMIELNQLLKFMQDYSLKPSINTFHLSKCQTGVIESLIYTRVNNKNDFHYGIYSEEWRNNEEFLKMNKNIIFDDYLSYNLFNEEVVLYCENNYKNNFDIITFCSYDELDKMKHMFKSIELCDIITIKFFYSLLMQKVGGMMIFKLPDVSMNIYKELLYFVSSLYDKVIIVKPELSNNLSMEKYVICKNYLEQPSDISNIYTTFLMNLIEQIKTKDTNKIIHGFLCKSINLYFMNKINEINFILFQKRVNVLSNIINLSNQEDNLEKLEHIRKKNISKCITWCMNNRIEYNRYLKDYSI